MQIYANGLMNFDGTHSALCRPKMLVYVSWRIFSFQSRIYSQFRYTYSWEKNNLPFLHNVKISKKRELIRTVTSKWYQIRLKSTKSSITVITTILSYSIDVLEGNSNVVSFQEIIDCSIWFYIVYYVFQFSVAIAT